MDHRRTLHVNANSETVRAHPDFRFVASANYAASGFDPLPREFRDRLVYVRLTRMDADREAKLLRTRRGVSANDADWLLRFAAVIRNAEPVDGASTRQLEAAATAIAAGIDRVAAATHCILGSVAATSRQEHDRLLNAVRAEGLLSVEDWGTEKDGSDADSIEFYRDDTTSD